MNLNKVMLIGRVGKDPEINYIKEDVPVVRFSMATNESYKTKEGEWRDITEWHNIIAWRQIAKYCDNNIKKGMLIFVEGKLQTRQWEGQDGIKRYSTDIIVDQVRLLEKKQDSGAPLPEEELPPAKQETENKKNDDDSFLNEEPSSNNNNKNDDLPF